MVRPQRVSRHPACRRLRNPAQNLQQRTDQVLFTQALGLDHEVGHGERFINLGLSLLVIPASAGIQSLVEKSGYPPSRV